MNTAALLWAAGVGVMLAVVVLRCHGRASTAARRALDRRELQRPIELQRLYDLPQGVWALIALARRDGDGRERRDY